MQQAGSAKIPPEFGKWSAAEQWRAPTSHRVHLENTHRQAFPRKLQYSVGHIISPL